MLTHLPGNTSIHFRKIRGSTKSRLDEKKKKKKNDVSLRETGGIVRMFPSSTLESTQNKQV